MTWHLLLLLLPAVLLLQQELRSQPARWLTECLR
jgi:hypothetical protein